MPQTTNNLLNQYVELIKSIYGNNLKRVILYGSYARGDYSYESDIDIMILVDIPENDIKNYRHQLSDVTFDFNMDNDVDIKPLAKSEKLFDKWSDNYPFYSNISREGVTIYGAA